MSYLVLTVSFLAVAVGNKTKTNTGCSIKGIGQQHILVMDIWHKKYAAHWLQKL